ncbi:hypothetical protein E3N88_29455 [Mikania micrantha]|uniref:Uncharacterized protein n=1 Tax=Mikania micrantha TaxID=192012 RepID=A0A5N6MJK4_9ASTR|nr:hypothetical protein E3N88_29455 [Mikania micrantha]
MNVFLLPKPDVFVLLSQLLTDFDHAFLQIDNETFFEVPFLYLLWSWVMMVVVLKSEWGLGNLEVRCEYVEEMVVWLGWLLWWWRKLDLFKGKQTVPQVPAGFVKLVCRSVHNTGVIRLSSPTTVMATVLSAGCCSGCSRLFLGAESIVKK